LWAPNVLFSAFTTEQDRGEWWGAELQTQQNLVERHASPCGEYRDDFLQEQRVSGQTPVERSRQSHGFI